MNASSTGEIATIPFLRKVAPWVAAIGVLFGVATAVVLAIRFVFIEPQATRRVLEGQVRAIVGVPMSAASAFCVVWLLEATSGRIEFEVIGFKFRGAAGPVVLWVMCFLSFVLSTFLLWK
jgi:hypothetical protein